MSTQSIEFQNKVKRIATAHAEALMEIEVAVESGQDAQSALTSFFLRVEEALYE